MALLIRGWFWRALSIIWLDSGISIVNCWCRWYIFSLQVKLFGILILINSRKPLLHLNKLEWNPFGRGREPKVFSKIFFHKSSEWLPTKNILQTNEIAPIKSWKFRFLNYSKRTFLKKKKKKIIKSWKELRKNDN